MRILRLSFSVTPSKVRCYLPRREVAFGRQLKEGDAVSASVVDTEMADGMVLLSLRKAVKEKGWDEISAKLDAGEIIEVQPYDANRGGLLVEYEGIRGFLPVSQLSAEHYPRVGGSDKDEILQRLNALVGKSIRVRILDADRKTNKLILSEKEAIKDGLAERFSKESFTEIDDFVDATIGEFLNVVDGLFAVNESNEYGVELTMNPQEIIKDTKVELSKSGFCIPVQFLFGTVDFIICNQ